MKFLLDQGLPRSAVERLRLRGIEAVHVGALGLHKASDETILETALRRQEVVATFDADFHAILAVTGAVAPSVVRIRIEGLNDEEAASILAAVLATARTDLENGAAVSVDSRRIRIRALPLK